MIEPLGKQHGRAAFSCGQPALDDWFRRRASQDEKRNIARVFVAVDDERNLRAIAAAAHAAGVNIDVLVDINVGANRCGVAPQVAPSLGRNLSACGVPTGACTATSTLNVLPPNTYFETRTQQLDFRVAKLLRTSAGRFRIALDLYNAFNRSPVLVYNQAFIPNGSWLIPNKVLSARQVRVNARFEF